MGFKKSLSKFFYEKKPLRRVGAFLFAAVMMFTIFPTTAIAATYRGTVRWNIAGSSGVQSGPTSGTIDLGTRTGSSWNNVSYTIPSLSSLGVTLKKCYTVNYVSVAANSSGNRQVGQSFLLSMSGGSMYYYLKQSHSSSYLASDTATCTSSGTKTYKCNSCGEVTRTETSPAKSHNWQYQYSSQPTSCAADGYTSYRCSNCGQTKNETIPALTHSWSDNWQDNGDGLEIRWCSYHVHSETRPAQVQNYTVQYVDSGNLIAQSTHTKGTVATVQDISYEKEGYEFKGWTIGSTSTVANWSAGDTFTINSDVTFVAVWECAHEHDADGYCIDPDCTHEDMKDYDKYDCCKKKTYEWTVQWFKGYDVIQYDFEKDPFDKGTLVEDTTPIKTMRLTTHVPGVPTVAEGNMPGQDGKQYSDLNPSDSEYTRKHTGWSAPAIDEVNHVIKFTALWETTASENMSSYKKFFHVVDTSGKLVEYIHEDLIPANFKIDVVVTDPVTNETIFTKMLNKANGSFDGV